MILFWDEFDNAHGQPSVASLLRNTWEEVKSGSLPNFQAVVCLGVDTAFLVAAFVKVKTYSLDVLNFSTREVRELFRQYQKAYSPPRQVDPEVQYNILKITEGHAGLINACGQIIQDSGISTTTMEVWERLLGEVIDSLKNRSVCQVMAGSLSFVTEPEETRRLLRRLCYGTGEWLETRPSHTNLLQWGFASIEMRT